MRLHSTEAGILLSVLLSAACQPAPSTLTQSVPVQIAEPPAVTVPFPTPVELSPTPEPTSIPAPPRAVLISLPGGCATSLDRWMEDGTMPALSALREEGLWSQVQGIDPSTSVVSHVSLATGRYPSQTGIPGERVHRPEDGFYWYTSAFDLSNAVEPVWSAIRREGLTSAALFWPGTMPETSQLASYTIGSGDRVAYSNLLSLTLYAAGQWQNAPSSFSPLQESQFTLENTDDETLAVIYVLAADTVDDSLVSYDTLTLSLDRVVDPADATLRVEEWSPWAFDPSQRLGADFLITGVSRSSLNLFHSGVYRLNAAPEDFLDSLGEQFQFFAPDPDYYALEHGWITEERYLDMVRRQSDWMMDVTLWVEEQYHPDLLMTVQHPIEQTAYQFMLVNDRQPGYSAQSAALYAEHLVEGAAQADQALARLWEQLQEATSPSRTAMIVVGTTCLAPIHTQVNLNLALAQSGLLRLGRGGFVVVQSSRAIAFSSGGSAHIYVNLSGREVNGIVLPDQLEEIQAQIAETLGNLVDPATGEPVLSRIVWRDELSELHLDSPYAGDIFVQAKPGYYLNDDRRRQSIFEPVSFYALQGYSSALTELQGGLVISGSGIDAVASEQPISLLDIAPSLASLLEVEFDQADEHRSIDWAVP